MFIDETWTKTNMAPLRGWAPRGQRLEAKVPHGRWKTMTFLAALRHDRLDAPWLIEGPINGETFRLYIDEVLLPTLRPGDIVVIPPHTPHGFVEITSERIVYTLIRVDPQQLLELRSGPDQ